MSDTYEFCKLIRLELLAKMTRLYIRAQCSACDVQPINFTELYRDVREIARKATEVSEFDPNALNAAEMDDLGFYRSGSPMGWMYYIPCYLVPFLDPASRLWFSPRQSFTGTRIQLLNEIHEEGQWASYGVFIPNK